MSPFELHLPRLSSRHWPSGRLCLMQRVKFGEGLCMWLTEKINLCCLLRDAHFVGGTRNSLGTALHFVSARRKVCQEARFWEEKKRIGDEAVYWSAFNIRKDVDAQILFRFQRPPGALPSSMLGYEVLTGSLDDFGFEDYLNVPQDSENFHPPDTHHGMEVRLGLSKGPICPSFS